MHQRSGVGNVSYRWSSKLCHSKAQYFKQAQSGLPSSRYVSCACSMSLEFCLSCEDRFERGERRGQNFKTEEEERPSSSSTDSTPHKERCPEAPCTDLTSIRQPHGNMQAREL